MQKILIIRFSSIGDIVLTTPVIRCLKQQLADSEIHFLTKKKFYEILKENHYLTKVNYIEKDISEVINDLKQENFDFIIDLHRNLRSFGIIFRLGKPFSSFPKLNIKKWLLTNFKVNLLPEVHIVDRYFLAVRKFKIINDQKGLDYYIPSEDNLSVNDIPLDLSNSFIAWAIGGAHNTKIFPACKIIEVINIIDIPVILLGGSGDIKRGEEIVNETGSKVYNACGKYSVNQSASIIKQSKLLITNDTGMMHIGAAFRKKIISIWGNTVPSFGMFPYMPGDEDRSTIIEINNLSCRPCSKIGYDRCPKKHFRCMEDIEVERLVGAIKSI